MLKHLRNLIAHNQLEAVLKVLHGFGETSEAAPFRDEISLLSARYKAVEQDAHSDAVPADEVRQARNRLSHALLKLVGDLEKELPPPAQAQLESLAAAIPAPPGGDKSPASRGLRENSLKVQVFFLLLLVKLYIFFHLMTLWQSGGFYDKQFWHAVGLITPILAAYLSLMLKDLFDRRHEPSRNSLRVGRHMQGVVYAVFGVYALAFFLVLSERGRLGEQFDFDSLINSFSLIETLLGAMIGLIVSTLFKAGGGK